MQKRSEIIAIEGMSGELVASWRMVRKVCGWMLGECGPLTTISWDNADHSRIEQVGSACLEYLDRNNFCMCSLVSHKNWNQDNWSNSLLAWWTVKGPDSIPFLFSLNQLPWTEEGGMSLRWC